MSEKLAREVFSDVQKFNAELNDAGWIELSDSFSDNKSPVDLFKNEERPLVVGLFGGTGVGKSSLLNRLAGADIARTGVVRPTSMEITAYLHHDVHLDALPDHFDAKSFSANKHGNDELADVMWVDMPDFDSDETENRDQVLQWLPHIDLLVYVVTPERYKDAEGWRMMLENGYCHAWLFVINQWDRAQSVQYSDFSGLLEGAGFSSPQIFRTVCVSEHEEDQFDDMVAVIKSLSKHNIVAHLQKRGWIQRLERSQTRLRKQCALLSADSVSDPAESFKSRWREFEQAAVSHLDRSFKDYSARFSEEKTSAVGSVLKSLTGTASQTDIASNIAHRESTATLWDDWLTVRCRDSIHQFELAKDEHGVPVRVFAVDVNNETIDAVADNAAVIERHLGLFVEAAIEAPGTQSQRFIAKAASVAKIVLPLLALVWIAWRIVNGFISGAEDRGAYVGLDFLVNGMLLAGLGWVVPMIVERIFVPSLPDSVYRALHDGLKQGLREIEHHYESSIRKIIEDRNRFHTRATQSLQRIDRFFDTSADTSNPELRGLLKSKL